MKTRLFMLTIGVYLWDDEPMPETFHGWIERANICGEGASTTFLESVHERRYPLATDVIEHRHKFGTGVQYG